MKFSIIFNPNAAGGKNIRLINKVINLIDKDHDVELYKTQSKDHAKLVFKELSKRNFDRLVVAGGDGSVSFAINEMMNYPSLANKPLGYIPVGTANILQIETKLKKNPQKIYDVLVSKNIKKVQLTKINEKYFFLMNGTGYDSRILKSINPKIKKYLGKLIFLVKGLQYFIVFKNEKIKVELNNQTIEANWVLITNSKYYAGPYSITNQTDIFDKKVIAFIFRDLTRLKILYYIWLIISKGDLSKATSIITKEISSLKISMDGNKNCSHIDGELFTFDNKLSIEKTNKYFELLV